ncbi:MAG: hypothetical protein ABUK19_06250 [Desulfobacteria bacterium]|jgi:Zn finger protein HypA/HybF involved in hydrogenase expression
MIDFEGKRSKGKYTVEAECPECGYGDIIFLGPDKFREEFACEEEIDVLCPICGTRHVGKLRKG